MKAEYSEASFGLSFSVVTLDISCMSSVALFLQKVQLALQISRKGNALVEVLNAYEFYGHLFEHQEKLHAKFDCEEIVVRVYEIQKNIPPKITKSTTYYVVVTGRLLLFSVFGLITMLFYLTKFQ